jgi:Response regulator receiver domain
VCDLNAGLQAVLHLIFARRDSRIFSTLSSVQNLFCTKRKVIARDKSLIGICFGYFGSPDLPVGRDATRPFLRVAGYQVDCVENGEKAIAAAAAKDYDVVLMDVHLPGMDGWRRHAASER